jgi:hypothetical protein
MGRAVVTSSALGDGKLGRLMNAAHEPSAKLVIALLAFLTACHLAMIWGVPYFASQDGPAHVYNAWILLHYDDPGFDLYRRYLFVSAYPVPNLLTQGVLQPLLMAFESATAEKMLASIYVVLWPAALFYAARSVRRRASWVALLGMPLCMNWFLFMGFYNYTYSQAIFLVVFGYWMRRRRRPRASSIAAMAVLLLLLYFSHIVSLAEALLALGIMSLTQLDKFRGQGWRGLKLGLLRLVLPWALAAVPCLVVSAFYLARSAPKDTEHRALFVIDATRMQRFWEVMPVHAFNASDSPEQWCDKILMIVFGAALILACFQKWARKDHRHADGMLIALIFSLAMFFVGPNNISGGHYLLPRLQFFPFMFALLWLAARPMGWLPQRVLQWLGVGLTLGMLVFRLPAWSGLQELYVEYLDYLKPIPRGATAYPIVLSKAAISPNADLPPQKRILTVNFEPMLHLSTLAASRGGWVDLSDYEERVDHSPVRWRPELDTSALGNLGEPVPKLDLIQYPATTKGTIDYVALWCQGMIPQQEWSRDVVTQQIAEGYRQIGESRPTGIGKLYRNKRASKKF